MLFDWKLLGVLEAWISLACEPVEAVERVEDVESERWLGVRPRVVRLRLSVLLIISSSSMSDL